MLNKKLVWVIIFAIAVYAIMLFFSDLQKITTVLSSFNFIFFVYAILLTIIAYLIRFVKWSYFLRISSIKINLKKSAFVFFSGLMMTIVPGRIGEVWRAWLLRDSNNTPLKKGLPPVIVERISDLMGLCILALLGLIFYPSGIIAITLVLICFLVFALLIQNPSMWGFIIKFLKRFFGKRVNGFEQMHFGFKKVLSFQSILITVGLSSIAWLFEGLGLYYILVGLGANLSIFSSVFVFSFSSVVGAVSFIPGGLGVAEASITSLLLFFGISNTIALVATILLRFATLWFGILLGVFVFLLFKKEFLKK